MFILVLIFGVENEIITKLLFPVKEFDMFTPSLNDKIYT